ncbi:alpha/beta hydrolase fold protein [Pseudarthrobacter chlorophenolicus A6]|uniref:Alpha/beta hydrolase fold protein n=1 Tax=Pseudarthrobacter chlorophenolicus (strain ATCC 700700 / DSM 12829 / CIP 107037 / JCM 12360 / KCTC 9906 / NCIMB 13794 / A6) TaxID=452863 RepID=B8HG11_PSECP|nr:alpha/beta hydrolase [Pseudarthrobacter chlorophenolicus]ACL41204.1 alpha/beta hydrolase fold protein [Pseudarthrobacter chlorophenolicus A6]SDQ68317.1 Pimeloyl-ACP methyl ester carboxylesterase [Pseudarthrobacter chlorophenolicus]
MTAFTVAPARGVELNCYDSGGAGPAVVLLHGLAGSAREFFPTADALPEYRAILVDLRGHGGSTRVPPGVARSDYVSDVVTVIERIGAPVVLVGQSMGAHTAMLVAAERPDLVGSLVLLECGAAGEDLDGHRAIGEYFRSWPTPFGSRDAASAFLGDGPLARAWAEDLEERADGFWPRFDPGVMAEAEAGLAAPRWREWHAVRAPALVVYGGQGMFTPGAKDAFVGQGHRVSRVDLPEASHDAHLDAFEDWVGALRGFLDREGLGQRRGRP